MALINCPECNKEISDTSKLCIHCGYTFAKNKPINVKTIIPILAVLAVTVIVILLFTNGILGGNSLRKNDLSEKEEYALNCVSELRDMLKNPESFQLHSATYLHYGKPYNCCVIDYSAQNGFGGLNRDSYLFIDNAEDINFSKRYQFSELEKMDLKNEVVAVVMDIIQKYYNDKSLLENIDTEKIIKFIN